ncbi:MAG TPA: succinate dehydrogenase, cytochrome b556 subunit, partial [Alphaproteobacteria bacterium]|nr:succinate dehydrogenase, cytochrome b556 subunit [Alphaproteobacteria bacterium]
DALFDDSGAEGQHPGYIDSAAPAARPRPTSPHLTIYRLPLTGPMLSIVHRATEVAMAFGLFILTWWCFAILSGPDAYAVFLDCARSILGRIVMIGLSWSVIYHTLYDIRQLFFDMGKGFEKHTIAQTGIMVVLASIIVTALVWVLACTSVAPQIGGVHG